MENMYGVFIKHDLIPVYYSGSHKMKGTARAVF